MSVTMSRLQGLVLLFCTMCALRPGEWINVYIVHLYSSTSFSLFLVSAFVCLYILRHVYIYIYTQDLRIYTYNVPACVHFTIDETLSE